MKSLAAALVEAQKDMPAVEADKTNPHFGNAFVSLDHLIAKTLPVLNKHGLAISQNPTVSEDGQPRLRTTLLHGESGEVQYADMPLLLAKNDMQGLGAAITYARRFAWASVLGICGEEDDDGNTASAPGTGATKDSGATSITGSAAGSGAAAAGASTAAPQHPAPGAASVKQQGFIKKLLGDNGFTVEDLAKPLDQFTKADASQAIEQLQAGTFNPASLAALGAGFLPDDDIPFRSTIDGIA